ncbi:MAG: hypothetical protein KIT10_14040 [Flavobacteriales bacterium]|nr:hypothetical protein [Flavobacteriales bacterium]
MPKAIPIGTSWRIMARSIAVVLCVTGALALQAQERPGDVGMMFSLSAVEDHATAKPVLKALMESEGVHQVAFIPGCVCFKLFGAGLTEAALRADMQSWGYEIDGKVVVGKPQHTSESPAWKE